VFHILTVHFRSEDWIDIQLRHIKKHLPEDTQVWACLNGIDERLWSRFEHPVRLQGSHAEKLNRLARMVSKVAPPTDHLVFIDGDAFPIARVDEQLLRDAPLAAVRRDENLGDCQPHPCFCVTTVGFWNSIGGDWREGYRWKNSLGYSVTDVGANLLRALKKARQPWTPLLRTNTVDLHPVFYAVYGNVVYHHGAGFRNKITRNDLFLKPARIPAWVPKLRDWERDRAFSLALRDTDDAQQDQAAISREIYESIVEDDSFYLRFTT
jgi:hypothetical protein